MPESLSVDQLRQRLAAYADGLSHAEVARRLSEIAGIYVNAQSVSLFLSGETANPRFLPAIPRLGDDAPVQGLFPRQYSKSAIAAGRRLRALRVEAGLSQVELAQRADVRQPTIRAYESGERRIQREPLDRLLAVLGARRNALDHFLGLEDTPAPGTSGLDAIHAFAKRFVPAEVDQTAVVAAVMRHPHVTLSLAMTQLLFDVARSARHVATAAAPEPHCAD